MKNPQELSEWPNYLLYESPEFKIGELLVFVSIVEQRLYLLQVANNRIQILDSFAVSTAKKGIGNSTGTGKTPLGWHQIKIKIGNGCPIHSVFVGRRFTGEIYSDELAKKFPERDWILSRILWLEGLQTGFNRPVTKAGQRHFDCDTLRRYIYIHGTPNTLNAPLGIPNSHGCIRMENANLLNLFDQLEKAQKVFIANKEFSVFEKMFFQAVELKGKSISC